MNKRLGLAIIGVALLAGVCVIALKSAQADAAIVEQRQDRQLMASALLSDLPGHYFEIRSDGACATRLGQDIEVLFLAVRLNAADRATVFATDHIWPGQPIPELVGDSDAGSAQSIPPVYEWSVALPVADRPNLAQFIESARRQERLPCILYRADQFIPFGAMYEIGMAAQATRDSEILLFPELALD